MNHLHDWRHYAQEKEEWATPKPELRELLLAMQSRMGATPNDHRHKVIGGKPVAMMSLDEYIKHRNGDARTDTL